MPRELIVRLARKDLLGVASLLGGLLLLDLGLALGSGAFERDVTVAFFDAVRFYRRDYLIRASHH